ncbi:MAG: alanine--tRNA ligase [Puniceicoccales bacterium]|jgi:alanyl-tRNA synthetase|nr:alanine--tRNA ligase [Puniceicoccales bacterium]
MDANKFRSDFLDFFRDRGHAIVPSSSLMPAAPNLLFTNAGMNQFVPYFLNSQRSPHGRIADVQKCIRAGGKHNDLDDVGYDCYHHTFFEMLGNWSFGDYFKEESIRWAWELLVNRWKFPGERLMATVYRPSDGEPASYDEEAYSIWCDVFRSTGLNPCEHVTYGGAKDNFWMMGETGPCGPCSEIHMDLTERGDGGLALVNGTNPRSMELWNLVFIQYNALGNGRFEKLSQNYVDTGMGLERIAGIWANTNGFRDFSREPSNYCSNLFLPLFDRMVKLSGRDIAYGHSPAKNRNALNEREITDCAFRAIGDHIRTLTLAIADGIFPGNEGRNYVLRRILRRAVLFGRRLDLRGNFLADLANVAIEILGTAYGNLKPAADVIRATLIREQEAFERTIGRGLQLMEEAMARCGNCIPGDIVFELHDTYGFPVDLSQLIAAEKNRTIDIEGFNGAMEKQRRRARDSQKLQKISVDATNLPPTEFVGYDSNKLNCESNIVAAIPDGNGCFLVTARSPFYGEMGGQRGDIGDINLGGRTLKVTDTQRGGNGVILHRIGEVVGDEVVGESAILSVDGNLRKRICAHHTATHILQAVLRKVLGNHVSQAGSSVDGNSLRFDFSHFQALSDSELAAVEAEANEIVRANITLHVFETEFNSRPANCLANFGERYGAVVRVVEIGQTAELCGGTHVGATGEIGIFKILGESGIAAGTRRICAVAGEAAYDDYASLAKDMRLLKKDLGGGDVFESVATLRDRLRNMEKAMGELEESAQRNEVNSLMATLGNSSSKRRLIIARPQDGGRLRSLGRCLQDKLAEDEILLLLSDGGDRWNFCIVGSANCSTAGDLAKNFAAGTGGGGGGKGNLACGTAPKCCGEDDPAKNSRLSAALERFTDH